MKLLVFAGSTRQKSFNRQLAKVTAAMATADVMKLKQITYEHPAWIICTPEYNASDPALLKNTLDWISSPVKRDQAWTDGFKSSRGKVVGMLSASPGAQ